MRVLHNLAKEAFVMFVHMASVSRSSEVIRLRYYRDYADVISTMSEQQ